MATYRPARTTATAAPAASTSLRFRPPVAPVATDPVGGRLPDATEPVGITRYKVTGSAMPLSFWALRASNVTSGILVRVRPRTVSLTHTSPAPAAEQMRAARLTADPTGPSAVSAVSPAWTPTPTWMGRSGSRGGATNRLRGDGQPRSHGPRCRREQDVEAVALGAHLRAGAAGDDLPDHPSISVEERRRALVAVRLHERRVATQVREQEAARGARSRGGRVGGGRVADTQRIARRGRELARGRVPLVGILGERPRDDRVERGGQLRAPLVERRGRRVHVGVQRRDVGVATVRRRAREALEQHAAERVDIAPGGRSGDPSMTSGAT